ncbi:MAG: leucine-rich repeat domain-containing protein, partial [Ruminococcus sp.]|nr:leucine-rich repeat domain-containing protein [Ruminococcus sp.]
MRKYIKSSLITFLICFSFLNTFSASANDATRVFEHDNYTESYYENGRLVCSGNGKFEEATWRDTVSEVIIEDGITEMGESIFRNAEFLYSVTLPSTLESISYCAFFGCNNLKNIELPARLSKIDTGAFTLSGIEEIYIPDNVNEICSGAFTSCSDLSCIEVSDNNSFYADIDGVLTDKNQQKLLCYPNGKSIETYEIPEMITEIDAYAFTIFNDFDLKSLVIPESVVKIDENAILTENNYSFADEKSQLIIYGYVDTTAETYALENGFTFIALDEEPITTTAITSTSIETTTTITSTETDVTDTSETTTTSTETDVTDTSETTTTSTETDVT